MKKMYIAVLDEAPDYMVPTLVAHTMISAHDQAAYNDTFKRNCPEEYEAYQDWFKNSFRKVVLKVSRKEFDKIYTTLTCWEGHENTVCEGKRSCLVVLPVESDNVPNVLKFAKMWKPSVPVKPEKPEVLKVVNEKVINR